MKRGDSLEKIRSEIVATRARIEAIWKAPQPLKEANAQVAKYVAEMATRSAPGLLQVIDHRENPVWPLARFNTLGADAAQVRGVDAVGLMCWLFPKEMTSALQRGLEERADDEHAMTNAQKAQATDEAAAALLMLERAEAAIVEAAGALHREDADPRAILNLE